MWKFFKRNIQTELDSPVGLVSKKSSLESSDSPWDNCWHIALTGSVLPLSEIEVNSGIGLTENQKNRFLL